MTSETTAGLPRSRPQLEEFVSPGSPYYGLARFWAHGAVSGDHPPTGVAKTFWLGGASAVLYFMLYEFQDTLIELSRLTRRGEKLDALVPITVALVFSVVHGKFTDSFWQILGVKPKGR